MDFELPSLLSRPGGWLTGRHLAYELQNALPDVEIRHHEDGDARPVRERWGR